jgi:NAD-dependent deacetylase sirtuin 1
LTLFLIVRSDIRRSEAAGIVRDSHKQNGHHLRHHHTALENTDHTPCESLPDTTAPLREEDQDRLSETSLLSDLSGADWKATAGPFSWVQEQMMKGTDPRVILKQMISADAEIPEHLDSLTLWKIILNMLSEPPKRTKLEFVNTLNDVVQLIKASSRIIVLTGAGVSGKKFA